MVTKKKKTTTKKTPKKRSAAVLKAVKEETEEIKAVDKKMKIPKINFRYATIHLVGETPLLVNKFDEKEKERMLGKQTGAAKKAKEFRDPDAEFQASLYKMKDKKGNIIFGIPAGGIRNCAISACSFIDGVAKTTARGAFQILTEGGDLVPIISKTGPVMDESIVRIGPWSNKVAMTRYRGRFDDWELKFRVKYNANIITPEQLLNLFENAGFAIGLCEWRPEKNGSKGMFRVKRES